MTAVGQAERKDGSRFYVDPLDEDRVHDSVTAIIKAVTGMPWLMDWSSGLAAEYAVNNLDLIRTVIEKDGPEAAVALIRSTAERRRNEARERGVEVHDIVEGIVLDRPLPIITPEIKPYVDGLMNFVEDHGAEFEMSEATVANNEHMYAGTLDLMALLHKHGRRLIIDTKTGRLDAGMRPQQAAYFHCDEVWLPFGQRAPMPKADGAAVLHLRPEYPDGYKMYEIEDLADEYEGFLEMRRVYARQRKAKARPGKVLYPPLLDGSQPLPLLEDIDGWGRARGVLLRHGFTTLGEVARAEVPALLDLKGFGQASLASVVDMLAAYDLTLTAPADVEAVA